MRQSDKSRQVIENNTQLCVAAEDGIVSWGRMAVARVKAKPKTVA
jgi:hypothetical protein